ncbi:MAG: MFS transporter, partial [Antricoccus sp.]
VNAASGRMIMGWFAKNERGLAMGIRQTAQPVGVAIAALALPPLASHCGIHAALLFPAALCALSAVSVWLWVIDPPRPAASDGQFARISPYRGSTNLLRVHLASSLLVVPQLTVASFTLVYLVEQQSWNATVAGRVVFVFQLAGALGRIVTGIWSDRVDSRLRPMRQLAATAAALMLLLALGAWLQTWWIVIVFGISAIVTVADNGLAFTSVAEIAGPHWAGRALGVHNTIQNVVSIACAPLLAVVISNTNYAWAFGIVAISPILAILVTPVRAERREPNTVSR